MELYAALKVNEFEQSVPVLVKTQPDFETTSS
jgi:hypothetical protein